MANVSSFVGIDVSKLSFTASYRKENRVVTRDWEYTLDGLESFLKSLPQNTKCVMEATGVYHTKLAFFLFENNVFVSVINPLSIKNYAKMQMKRTKTDKSDSKLLLDYAELMNTNLAQWSPKADYCVEIKQLYSMLESKNAQLTRVKNKLEALTHSKQQSSFCIKMCIEDIKHLEVEISSIEEEIERIVKEHAKKDFDILTSIPGIGKKTACLFIAMTDSVKRFDNYKQVISYFGMSPRTYDSGTSVHSKAKICKVGLSTIRKNMYLCGLSARKYNKSCKDLYDRLVEKGKAKKLAIIAVANKIIKQAFALIKKQVFYDENFSSSLAF